MNAKRIAFFVLLVAVVAGVLFAQSMANNEVIVSFARTARDGQNGPLTSWFRVNNTSSTAKNVRVVILLGKEPITRNVYVGAKSITNIKVVNRNRLPVEIDSVFAQ